MAVTTCLISSGLPVLPVCTRLIRCSIDPLLLLASSSHRVPLRRVMPHKGGPQPLPWGLGAVLNRFKLQTSLTLSQIFASSIRISHDMKLATVVESPCWEITHIASRPQVQELVSGNAPTARGPKLSGAAGPSVIAHARLSLYHLLNHCLAQCARRCAECSDQSRALPRRPASRQPRAWQSCPHRVPVPSPPSLCVILKRGWVAARGEHRGSVAAAVCPQSPILRRRRRRCRRQTPCLAAPPPPHPPCRPTQAPTGDVGAVPALNLSCSLSSCFPSAQVTPTIEYTSAPSLGLTPRR